jgi:hypothetical protein
LGGSPAGVTLGSGLKQAWIVGYKGGGGVGNAGNSTKLGLSTGHFGIKFDNPEFIPGYHPNPTGVDISKLGTDLKAGNAYPGWLKDDYELFKAAYGKESITVIEAPVLMPEGQFYTLRDWYTANIKTPLDIQYSFPPRNEIVAPDWGLTRFNCVTLICDYHGVVPPGTFTGKVSLDIPTLLTIPGAKPWVPQP